MIVDPVFLACLILVARYDMRIDHPNPSALLLLPWGILLGWMSSAAVKLAGGRPMMDGNAIALVLF